MASPQSRQRRPPPPIAPLARIAHPTAAILLLFLAGCSAINFLKPAGPDNWIKGSLEGADVSSASFTTNLAIAEPCANCPPAAVEVPAGETPKPGAKPPPPHTLCEAFRAYLHCLRYGPPPAEDKSAKEEPSKNPPEDKGASKNGNGKTADQASKGQPEPSKNPPADNGAVPNGAGKSPNGKNGKDEPSKNPPTDKDSSESGNGKDQEKANGKAEEKGKEEAKEDWYSAHAQATVVTEKHDRFRSPYQGPLSLPPVEPYTTSETTTVFLATRLWEGGELVFNPEVAGGRGFGNVTGIANFPNAEITRVGVAEPTPYIARLFLRQTFGFGGEQEQVEDALNQIAGKRDISRLTVSIGKFAATDIADDNRYSHDPRTQFLPWAMVYTGAWDYPANVRGYTYGVAFDLNQKDWALRYGVFAVARFANSAEIDPRFLKANGHILELENRYTLNDHPGKLRLWSFVNFAHMGNYREALAEMPMNPDITQTRAYRAKYGFGGNVEQELTKDLGAFSRFGWNDGHTETWMFTEIDATLALGLLLKGRCWCRPEDTVGLAFAANALSQPHRDYLAAGGLGFIIGDGRLNYGLEKTIESFYNFEVHKGISFALDLQEIFNPAYNRDRGPVFVASGRLHLEF